jgi:pyruvate ferredoxin oxidoreductase gamma subunit
VTAAELIALAAFYEGRQAQAFPNFGVERTGAPIQSYVRLSDEPIITREQIYAPTILIIQDATLLDTVDVLAGAQKNTRVIINAPVNRWPKLKIPAKNIYCSPATEIALKILGKNIVNTVILGALAKFTGLVSLESLQKAIAEKFNAKGQALIDKNIQAVTEAYEK